MESEAEALTTGELPSVSELDRNGHEPNEELLLLQMMEVANDVASPNLDAILDDGANFSWQSGQRQQSPLLMERPQTSGIEATSFSFAKPAQNSRPFSLQPLKVGAAVPTPLENPRQNGLAEVECPSKGNQTNVSSSKTTRAPTRSYSYNAEKPSASTDQVQRSNSNNPLTVEPESRPDLDHQSALENQEGQVRKSPINPGQDHQNPVPENIEDNVQGAQYLPMSRTRYGRVDHFGDAEELIRGASYEDLALEINGLPEPPSQHDQWKVVKRRPSDKRRANKRESRVPSNVKNSQVPEEVLFQQLIGRLRAREESEAVASHVQKEMEAKITTLQDENKALHEELQKVASKLRQRTNEARIYKSQTDSWKSKLAKIKNFLNELGADYQNLRGEAIHFKAARRSLDKERKEISETIEDVKTRLNQMSQFSRERRGCLLESESLIATLRQELKRANEIARYSQNQVVDEKKRSHLLELYIQNSSRTQDKKLELVKSGQLELMKKLEAALKSRSNDCELSQIISDNFRHKMEEIVALVRSTAERISDEKISMQQCRKIVSEFESRVDSTTRQLTQEIERNSDFTGKKMSELETQLQLFRASIGEGSALFTELSASGSRCFSLESKLNEIIPRLENFNFGIDGLQQKEATLGQQIDQLERSLSEAKLPEQFGKNYIHLSEKLNLENEMQQLCSKLKSTEEKLEAHRVDSLEKHQELLRVTALAHQAELNAAKFESQATGLQEKLRATEAKARDDQDQAIARSRDQCMADFQRQLHAVMMDKAAVEVATERVKEKLAQAQNKLVEVENTAKEQRRDLESLLAERQTRIDDLEKVRNEFTSNLAKQEAEITKLRDQETNLTSQQISLQLQLGEANRRSDSLENERARATAESQKALESLQDNLSSLRSELVKKEGEHQALTRELESMNVTRDNLEAHLSDAKAGIQALHEQVQELNGAIKAVRETFDRLDIARSEQPLPEALIQLDATIQSVNSKKSEPVKQNQPQTLMHAASRMDQGTQTLDGCIDMGLPATEPILPVEDRGYCSPSGQGRDIVPFSSITQKMGPNDHWTTESDPFDLSTILTQTPERSSSIRDPMVPTSPENKNPFADIKPQNTIPGAQPYRIKGIKQAVAEITPEQIHKEQHNPMRVKEAIAGRKVSFEAQTQMSADEDDDLQVPDSQANSTRPGLVVLSLNGSHSTRTNRWTYSKRQRESLTDQQKIGSSEEVPSQMKDPEGYTDEGSNKRVKMCSTPPKATPQTRKSSGAYNRRQSPTRLASGSSRARSSEAMLTQKGLGRSTRNSARMARAEKYNARFSQGA
ncbi:hypothetical protein BJX64DRAFT_283691 [Aspergillus heterothallicus]